MKKYIFAAIAVVTSLFTTSCSDDDAYVLDSISVSSSYVAIPLEGGSSTITINAAGDWQLEIDSNTDEWLDVSADHGTAGETQVTFSAEAALDGRTAEQCYRGLCGRYNKPGELYGYWPYSEWF